MPGRENQSNILYIDFTKYDTIKNQMMNLILNRDDRANSLKQQLQLIQHTGHFFKMMSLQIIFSSNKLIPVLDLIAKYCTHLKYLAITGSGLMILVGRSLLFTKKFCLKIII
jgi:hypothetical protein